MTSTIKVNNIQNQCGQNIINENSNTITLGASGDTIALASGASQTGFGRTGTVDWQTGSIKTATFTAANGEGYFCNTAGGSFEVDLPAGSAGAIVSIQDYNNTFDTNNLTIDPNGSEKINGGDAGLALTLSTEGQGLTLVYIDSTVGWRSIHSDDFAQVPQTPTFICASVSGSCNTLVTAPCGDFKIATFKGPGNFTVSSVGNAAGSNSVEYIVVAGGGSGGNGDTNHGGGGGGAGGFRFASPSLSSATYPAKTLAAPANLPVSAQAYPIVVGGGGAGPSSAVVNPGSVSTFSTITSTGGGGGANQNDSSPPANLAADGGSGGGSGVDSFTRSAGSGNTPPVSPPQGNPGAQSIPNPSCGYGGAGGGGGAIQAGQQHPSSGPNDAYGGNGGNGGGFPNAFGTSGESSSPFYYFAGGGAGSSRSCVAANATGGLGGGGDANPSTAGAGTANTGGGGSSTFANAPGGSGGSGIVIIRYKFQ